MKPLLLLFLIISILQCFAEFMDVAILRSITKLLTVPVLATFLILETKLKGRFHKRIMIGLVFAWIADILLTVYPNHFLYPSAALFLNVVFYIRAFSLDYKSNPDFKIPYFLYITIALAVFCSGFFFYLQPNLGPFQFPVLMYLIAMVFLAIMAVNRFGRVNLLSFKFTLAAVFFLLCSNAFLALNSFVYVIPNAATLILATYITAQYLIVAGTIERKLVVTATEI
ncbi:lysoplasmalogenase [Pedobacter sp. AW1-32]|uniref:lysoplasmalogenase n=1 Tax=Pedobacter sp. AW1-32 TaxID=3383026 RepID=UPI003FEE29F8